MINSKNIIITLLLIIALSFVYYFIIFLPNKESAKRELEREKFNAELRFKTEQAQNKENNLNNCIATAHEYLSSNWKLRCSDYGLNNKKENCNLPAYFAEDLNKDYKEDQELCIKKYK